MTILTVTKMSKNGSMPGCGSPGWMKLERFGDVCRQAFGVDAWLVGSAITKKRPRDVDVRMKFSRVHFVQLFGRLEAYGDAYSAWGAMCLAFSSLGKEMTGLKIDFQIQHSAAWNVYLGQTGFFLGSHGDPMGAKEIRELEEVAE